MRRQRKTSTLLLCAALAAGTTVAGIGSAYADAPPRDRYQERDRSHQRERHAYPIHRGHRYAVPPDRMRHYRGVVILRPYGHRYPGYGPYHRDADAYKWLAFTAITLAILDNLNESQQRAYEAAQIRAATAPVGETIIWREGGATGSVAAVREGVSTSGRYCREFQQKVTIGGKTEEAYGTACRQPDGTWEVVSTGGTP
jgi:hypothetical protein